MHGHINVKWNKNNFVVPTSILYYILAVQCDIFQCVKFLNQVLLQTNSLKTPSAARDLFKLQNAEFRKNGN